MRGSGTLTVPTWVKRHLRAVGLDGDRLEQARAGAARPQALQFLAQHLERAVHALLEIRQVGLLATHDAASSLMMVWGPSPRSTRANEPGACTEKTMMGMLLSRAREIAEASITLRSRASTSR